MSSKDIQVIEDRSSTNFAGYEPVGYFSCPKCGYNNQKGNKGCTACGLIFAKWNRPDEKIFVPSEMGTRAAWEKVKQNFHQSQMHNLFFTESIKNKDLPFMAQKYSSLLKINRSDDISEAQLSKIQAYLNINLNSKRRVLLSDIGAKPSWLFIPSFLGYLFFVTGLFWPGLSSLMIVGGLFVLTSFYLKKLLYS